MYSMDSELAQFVMVITMASVIGVVSLPFILWWVRKHPQKPYSQEEYDARLPSTLRFLKFGILLFFAMTVSSFAMGRPLSGSIALVFFILGVIGFFALRRRTKIG
jgi:Na+/H+ antiporter NhaD/arsenite permease-like protein